MLWRLLFSSSCVVSHNLSRPRARTTRPPLAQNQLLHIAVYHVLVAN